MEKKRIVQYLMIMTVLGLDCKGEGGVESKHREFGVEGSC